MSSAAPWITVAFAELYLTSGSSLPTKRKIRLPMGGNKAQARIVYRFLLLPLALGIPPMGAGCPGGGGGICDIGVLLEILAWFGPDYGSNAAKTPEVWQPYPVMVFALNPLC